MSDKMCVCGQAPVGKRYRRFVEDEPKFCDSCFDKSCPCGESLIGLKKKSWEREPSRCDSCFEYDEEHAKVIEETSSIFHAAGFGPYDLDFSDIDIKLIRMLAETCKKYNEESK